MLLIDSDICLPLAIWTVFPHIPMTGVKSDYIYFRVILSINSWHFTLPTGIDNVQIKADSGREI